MNNYRYFSFIATPVGELIAIADKARLTYLHFTDCLGDESLLRGAIKLEDDSVSTIISNARKELEQYFSGEIKEFYTPFYIAGTEFQERVWTTISEVKYGETESYLNIAKAMASPKSQRAVANSLAKNKILILIPCHRIIGAGSEIYGYSAGPERKKYLLNHEEKWS